VSKRCIGSAQHLKSRYGDGYQLSLKIAELKSKDQNQEVPLVRDPSLNEVPLPQASLDSKAQHRFDSLCRFIESTFKEAMLIEVNGSQMLRYRIPKTSFSLSDLFRIIEENRTKYFIEAYSVSETTLEQIFIHFARQQEEETGIIPGLMPVPRSVTGLDNVVRRV